MVLSAGSAKRLLLSFAAAAGVAAGFSAPAIASAAHPCKPYGYAAVKFVSGVSGTAFAPRLRIRNGRQFCGGLDDGYTKAVGELRTVRLASHPEIELLPKTSDGSITERRATLAQLRQLVRLGFHDRAFTWINGAFGVKLNSRGQTDSLTELYHP
jgi:hypothetical protein